ncbi:MAG: Verru_Chthon cassette protein D [Chthoniobacteraceae bacterium]|nr:Verru_Chthon cassette protein D [Chthoniobacteraceae bacterium]
MSPEPLCCADRLLLFLYPEKKSFPLIPRSIPSSRLGFTLIELLAVMGVMVLVAMFAMPAVNPLLKGSQLAQGAQDIGDQLGLARQTAISSNHCVEVRFYKYADAEAAGEVAGNPATGHFRAIQLFEIPESGGPVALGKLRRLPASVVIDGGSTLSSLLNPPAAYASPLPVVTSGGQSVALPRVGTQYTSVAFRFLPDGSMNLSCLTSNPWFLTLRSVHDKDPSNGALSDAYGKPPHNFFTIQIDATNGHIKTYRP